MSGAVEAPITADDHWFVGEARVFRHVITDDTGMPVNITGWTLQVVLRSDPEDTAALLTITPTLTSAVNGELTWTVTAAQSLILGRRRMHYALVRTNAGFEAVLAYGFAILGYAASR